MTARPPHLQHLCRTPPHGQILRYSKRWVQPLPTRFFFALQSRLGTKKQWIGLDSFAACPAPRRWHRRTNPPRPIWTKKHLHSADSPLASQTFDQLPRYQYRAVHPCPNILLHRLAIATQRVSKHGQPKRCALLATRGRNRPRHVKQNLFHDIGLALSQTTGTSTSCCNATRCGIMAHRSTGPRRYHYR